MPEIKDKQPIRARIHIVLRGPDGEIKDERTTETLHQKKEVKDAEKSTKNQVPN